MTAEQPPLGTLTPQMAGYARATAEWSRRVAICALVVGSIIVIVALIVGGLAGRGKGAARPLLFSAAVLYLGLGALTLFIGYLLRRFSTSLRIAGTQNRVAALAEGFAYESAYWRIVGVITALSLAATIISAAVPTFRAAMAKSQDRRTVEGIDAIGAALEKYALANSRYPQAGSIDQLAGILEPRFIAHIPRRDGFDRPFDYAAICDKGFCPEYRLSSSGQDAKYSVDPKSIDASKAPEATATDDYVFANGRFLLKP